MLGQIPLGLYRTVRVLMKSYCLILTSGAEFSKDFAFCISYSSQFEQKGTETSIKTINNNDYFHGTITQDMLLQGCI